jgi:prepilin-type N-terminal cleavage/methylation domain-containing protein
MSTTSNNLMRHGGGRARAFTLIEILCVVVILGISAAIILPQMGNRDDLRAASMARTIIADLSYVQSLAVARQAPMYVRFDKANNRYEAFDQLQPSERLLTHPLTNGKFQVNVGPARKDALKDVVLDDVTFDTQSVLMFDEMGVPHSYNPTTSAAPALVAGSVRVKSHNYKMTVSVQPYSGELKVN